MSRPWRIEQAGGLHRFVTWKIAQLVCLPALVGLAAPSVSRAMPGSFTSEQTQEPIAWTLSYQGRKVMVYSFAPGKFKPYVKELCTLQGHNILRDAPHDHLHHHGLMYGIMVNGINFWEEVSGSGVEKPVQTLAPVMEWTGSRLPQSMLVQVLQWVAPEDAFLPDTTPVALLIERRTLTLTLNPALKEVALEWDSQFEVGAKTNTVVLSGTKYDGLGLRFEEKLDPLAVHSVAGLRPDLAGGRQDVSSGPWASVSFDTSDWAATVAIAGHPDNAHGQPAFFSMLTPFAYLSATQALNREPLVYHTGKKFRLRYLVLLNDQAQPSAAMQQQLMVYENSSWHQP